jgi:hypothetical protein
MLKRKSLQKEKGQYSIVTVTSWLYNNQEVATSRTYKDYVHAKPGDTIRTKYTRVSDIHYNRVNLTALFPNLKDDITHLSSVYKLEKKEGSIEFWITHALRNILPREDNNHV